MRRSAVVLLLGLALTLLVTGRASAQVSIEAQIGARRIEVGDGVQFQITALSPNDEAPQNPHLPSAPGLSISGPSIGSRTQVSISGGRMVQQTGISANWTVRALKVGTFRIGPASVDWNGKRFLSDAVSIEVVPQGSLPRAPRGGGPQPFDPFRFFDPFGGGSPFPPGLLGPGDLDQQQELPPVPDEYRVDHAPDSIAFLRATVSPKHPVVGEQVTVRIYAYGGRGPFRGNATADPTYPDFLDYSGQDDSFAENAVQVPIGDTVFIAQKLKEYCLFPLHAGRLTIGPMTFTFEGGRYRANPPPLSRSSPTLTVDVSEPPIDGRPAGYRLGDVGTLELSSAVDPKRVTAGDSVGVVAKLEGTGSIPTVLHVPEQRGVEWLEPTRVDEVHADHGTVRGFRAFNYVVKLHDAGTVDLGELTIAYFDPKKHTYQTARTALGKVVVVPSEKPAAVASAQGPAAAAADPLALKPRRSLTAYGSASAPFTDGGRFWYLLFGAPLAVVLSGAGLELGGRWRRTRAAARSNPARLAQEALRAAESAAKGSEVANTASAVERAVFLAIEAGSGVRARALLKDDLKAALGSAAVPEAVVERTLALLDACEAARFTGKAGDLPPKELCARAQALLPELSRKRSRS